MGSATGAGAAGCAVGACLTGCAAGAADCLTGLATGAVFGVETETGTVCAGRLVCPTVLGAWLRGLGVPLVFWSINTPFFLRTIIT